MFSSSVQMQALSEQPCLDQIIQLVLSAFRLEPILTWRYTEGEKNLGLLVLSDLALMSTTLSIPMWSCTSLLFPGNKKQDTMYCLCVAVVDGILHHWV